jgi:hypothetical protein
VAPRPLTPRVVLAPGSSQRAALLDGWDLRAELDALMSGAGREPSDTAAIVSASEAALLGLRDLSASEQVGEGGVDR